MQEHEKRALALQREPSELGHVTAPPTMTRSERAASGWTVERFGSPCNTQRMPSAPDPALEAPFLDGGWGERVNCWKRDRWAVP